MEVGVHAPGGGGFFRKRRAFVSNPRFVAEEKLGTGVFFPKLLLFYHPIGLSVSLFSGKKKTTIRLWPLLEKVVSLLPKEDPMMSNGKLHNKQSFQE